MFDERNYGGVSPEDVGELGTPNSDTNPTGMPCPHCGNKNTYHITLPIKAGSHPVAKLMRGVTEGGTLWGNYVGCPACPWASKMMMTSVAGKREHEEGDVVVDTTDSDGFVEQSMEDVSATLEADNNEVEAKLRTVLVEELSFMESLSLDSAADRNTLIDRLTKSFMNKYTGGKLF